MFVSEIEAQLRANVSDFKAKFQDADATVQQFGKGAGKLGEKFLGSLGPVTQLAGRLGAVGLVIGAVVGTATMLWERLKNVAAGTDENVAAAKRFQGAIEEGAKTLKSWRDHIFDAGIKAVGVVNSFGEMVGKQIAIVKHGKEQVAVAEQIAEQAERTLAAIEKDKKLTEEIAALKAKARDVEKKRAEDAEKELDIRTRIALAESKLQAAKDELARADGNRLEAAKAELKISETRAELDKVRAEQTKQVADAEKKAAEEKAKDAAKLAELKAQWDEEEFDRLVDQARAEREANEARAKAERDRIPVLEEEAKKLMEQGTTREQMIATLRGLGFEEEKILAVIDQQNQKLQFQIQLRSKGRGDTELSDRVIEDKIRSLTAQLTQIDREDFGSSYRNPLRPQIQKELDFARDELADRNRVRTLVSRFGEQGAERFYKGNMPNFERLLQHVGDADTAKKTLVTLQSIEARLAGSPSGMFPRQPVTGG